LPENMSLLENTNLELNAGVINYRVDSVSGDNLFLKYGEALSINASADIDHFSSMETMGISAQINDLKVDLKALQEVFKNIEIPEDLAQYRTFNLNGSASGNLKRLHLD